MDSVYFEKIDKNKIFCFLSEPAKSNKRIVIMSHGFRGSSVGPARQFVDFSRLLVSNGFSVLRFDQPNSGNSDGDYIDSSFDEWVKTIVYLARKFLHDKYKVALMGQSMGATASVIASNNKELSGKIPCLILWVPDPKSTFDKPSDTVFEEAGQKYTGAFAQESKNTDFFKCLEKYNGGIHLVYGEKDRYVSIGLRKRVIKEVKRKKQKVMVLEGQDHSPWKYDAVQKVYKDELNILKKYTI